VRLRGLFFSVLRVSMLNTAHFVPMMCVSFLLLKRETECYRCMFDVPTFTIFLEIELRALGRGPTRFANSGGPWALCFLWDPALPFQAAWRFTNLCWLFGFCRRRLGFIVFLHLVSRIVCHLTNRFSSSVGGVELSSGRSDAGHVVFFH